MDDDANNQHVQDDANGSYDDDYYDDGWGEYEPTAVAPGRSFFFSFLVLAIGPMLVLMPLLVTIVKGKKKRKKKKVAPDFRAKIAAEGGPYPDAYYAYYVMQAEKAEKESKSQAESEQEEEDAEIEIESDITKVRANARTIFRLHDKETKRILGYALPFTFSAVTSSILSNVCLALIAHFVGTKQVSAFVIVDVLLHISQEIADSPISATTSLCAHAIGAGNSLLAGQYVQLSWLFYLFTNGPLVVFWIICMERVVLYLEWGDGLVAKYSHDLVKIYVFRYVVDSLHEGLCYLLEVTNHITFTTVVGLLHDLVDVGLLALMIWKEVDMTVQRVSWMYLITSLLFFFLTVGFSWSWMKPFHRGMFLSWAPGNWKAVKNMARTSIPLAMGSLLSNAEWTVLTFFASYLGPAEVAGWAFIGSLWSIFDSTTEGIGDAAEIRVSYHLGNNHPSLAKLSAYKTLYLGLLVSSIISGVLFAVSDRIPAWFTPDETLQGMIADVLPYIGIGNISLTFGLLCWYLVGAQGRYKLATWIQFAASWAICMPFAAVFTFKYRFNLEGLMASVVLGYVAVGSCLSIVILTSDWQARANKVRERNEETVTGGAGNDMDEMNSEDVEEGTFAALASGKSRGARAAAGRNLTLLSAPPGPIHIKVDMLEHRDGAVIVDVPPSSPFEGMLYSGDTIVNIDGTDVTSKSLEEIQQLLRKGNGEEEREMTVATTPCHYRDEETETVLLTGQVPDIDDDLEKAEEDGEYHYWA